MGRCKRICQWQKTACSFAAPFVGTRRAVSADFSKGKSRWKRSTGTFPNQQYRKRDTGRSGLVRSALEKLSLFSPTFSVRQKHGAGNFAVCGQRLRGHVPSKNTSPAALSWSSLIGQLDEMHSVSAHIRFLFRTTIIFSAQQKSSATSRISSARGGASLFSLSCPAQAQRSGLTSSCVRSSVWLRLQLQTLPVRWEPEQLQTHPWFSACC